jgi:hypothetical protein
MDLLDGLEPVSGAYATMPIGLAFNWREASAGLGEGEWYLVAFRSARRPGSDEARLNLFDELAHQEAATSPGFVHYYKGPAAPDGSCLSFCLWESRAHAREAAGRPEHVSAVSLIDEMYVSYTLEFHRVTRVADGPLSFQPYDRAPVHGGPANLVDAKPDLLPPALPITPAIAF